MSLFSEFFFLGVHMNGSLVSREVSIETQVCFQYFLFIATQKGLNCNNFETTRFKLLQLKLEGFNLKLRSGPRVCYVIILTKNDDHKFVIHEDNQKSYTSYRNQFGHWQEIVCAAFASSYVKPAY